MGYSTGQKVWYVDNFYSTPEIRVLVCTIKRKNCCELELLTSNNYGLKVNSNSKKLFDNPGDAHSLCSKMIKKQSQKIKKERERNV